MQTAPVGKRVRRLLAKASTCERGVAAIEFGFVAPILALAIIGTVDLGLGVYRSMQVHTAAQAGAQYAMTHGFSSSGITNATTSATSFSAIAATPEPTKFCGCPSTSGVNTASCSTACPDASQPGTYVTVSAQGTYSTLIPWPMLPSSFAFAARSTVRME
jgi:Flp pilus assembly protein TadG